MLQRYAAGARVLSEIVDDEVVLLDLGSTCYFGLNPVGALVWECLIQGQTVKQAVEAVLERYQVQAEPVRADVRALVQSLLQQGLLMPRQEPQEPGPVR